MLLKWLFKKIDILDVSYKKNLFTSVLIKIIIFLVTFVIPLMIGVMDAKKLVYWFLISLILSFIVSYALFNRYYKIDVVQGFLVFIIHSIVVILLFSIPYEVRFAKEIYIKTWQPQKINETCYSRPDSKWTCEPSLICAYSPGCTGDDTCLATGSCGAKNLGY
jgi:hypothetical protein